MRNEDPGKNQFLLEYPFTGIKISPCQAFILSYLLFIFYFSSLFSSFHQEMPKHKKDSCGEGENKKTKLKDKLNLVDIILSNEEWIKEWIKEYKAFFFIIITVFIFTEYRY